MNEQQPPDTAIADGLALPIASKGDKGFLRSVVELKQRAVPMPEWGVTVIVREMTAQENREYQTSNVRFDKGGFAKGFNKEDVELRLLLRTCMDDHNVRLFTEDDFPLLRRQPASVIARLTRIAKELSGLDDDGDADEREERAKND